MAGSKTLRGRNSGRTSTSNLIGPRLTMRLHNDSADGNVARTCGFPNGRAGCVQSTYVTKEIPWPTGRAKLKQPTSS